jgi:putative membrane protein
MRFVQGFFMAAADSVPGVSGGTVAFLLGFYDEFINALDDLFKGKLSEKKKALLFLIKIGIGWVAGFVICALLLVKLFDKKIYGLSSLFLGFIIFAIPLVIIEEKEVLKGKYKNIIFSILGMALVVGISLLNTKSGLVDVGNITHLTIPLAIYIFLTGAIAITAMVLPGISGSTLLLIFGLYMPIMTAVKKVLSFNFSYALPLLIFLAGILVGIVTFVRLIKKSLVKYRSQTIYTIIGMMLGSLYAIVQGPTTLKVPQPAMTFSTFSIVWFIIGALIIFGLQVFKKVMEK